MRYTNSLKFAPGDILSLVQNPSFSGTVSSLFGRTTHWCRVAPYNYTATDCGTLGVAVLQSTNDISLSSVDLSTTFRPTRRFPDVRLIRLEGDRVIVAGCRTFSG